MAIQRWDPVRDLVELQNRLNRMFEDVLSRSNGSGEGEEAVWHPPVDLHEESGRYVLQVDLPGVSAEEVEIQIENGTLRLRGERRPREGGAESFVRTERPRGPFSVQVALPPSVDARRVRASQRNGVVEVELPKRQSEPPNRIDVTPK